MKHTVVRDDLKFDHTVSDELFKEFVRLRECAKQFACIREKAIHYDALVLSGKQLADKYGLTEARVSQIKRSMKR